MKFNLVTTALHQHAGDCVVVGVWENQLLAATTKNLAPQTLAYLQQFLAKKTFTGELGETFFLWNLPSLKAKYLLLIGCGKEKKFSIAHYLKIIHASVKALNTAKINQAIFCLDDLDVEDYSPAWKIKQLIAVSYQALYQFDQFKSQKKVNFLRSIEIYSKKISPSKAQEAIKQGIALAQGIEFTKNLANLPSNIATPTYVAKKAQEIAKKYRAIQVNVLEENTLKKLGMGALLTVAKGSHQPPKLICLEYKGTAKTSAPIALVGKGITFDTGGISLKSADGMVGMKYDMCGAAAVLGIFTIAAQLKLPLHLVGILAMAENMPGGNAGKPEDIVTSLSGQTIEIMSTDAEGRLVLCDALTYVERYKPQIVIDIATLTGSVVMALGHHASGLLANYQPLADELLAAGIRSHDRAWQMPLWEEYQDQLRSPFADMSNTGGRAAGVITAACFLSRFTKKFHWAHLDVAGTAAMMGGSDRYATGRPVPMLVEFLLKRCERSI